MVENKQMEKLMERIQKNYENANPLTDKELNQDWGKKEKPEYEINGWSIEQFSDAFVLKGYITDHPNVGPGDRARTSFLKSIDFETMTAETRNSTYKLGE